MNTSSAHIEHYIEMENFYSSFLAMKWGRSASDINQFTFYWQLLWTSTPPNNGTRILIQFMFISNNTHWSGSIELYIIHIQFTRIIALCSCLVSSSVYDGFMAICLSLKCVCVWMDVGAELLGDIKGVNDIPHTLLWFNSVFNAWDAKRFWNYQNCFGCLQLSLIYPFLDFYFSN